MIIILKPNAEQSDIDAVCDLICTLRYQPRVSKGEHDIVISCIGNGVSPHAMEVLRSLPMVDRVVPIQKKYKLVSREFHPEDTIITVGGEKIGGGNIPIIAGPCAIESYGQFRQAVKDLVDCGIKIIRAMPFKPRTSPYDFQGLKLDGIRIMRDVKEEFGISYISEVPGLMQIKMLNDICDIFQIGARNAQNFDLLENIAQYGKPVLLKRGMAETIEEWLTAAEYLVSCGSPNVILCERGIRTFETATRNTLDLSAVVVAKSMTHLPVIVDPSHAAGKVKMVPALARAALAVGADGLLVETHPDPVHAFSDAAQQIPSAGFQSFIDAVKPWLDLAKSLPR
ncbi:MAG: bifunctional 3-deoxy-7-phosphoheptulonate synthase/chorismate mutase [Kiritimatiellia bacterium]